jgi:hypothetical protein
LFGATTVATASVVGATTTAVNANINTLANDAKTNGGTLTYYVGTNSSSGAVGLANAIAYAIYGKLTAPSVTTYFCIDSTGGTNPAALSAASSTCPTAGN